MNSKPIPIYGQTRNVEIRIGGWQGGINFSVVDMDDHELVLGMEFLDRVKAVPVPSCNSLCILKRNLVLSLWKAATPTLSSMQFSKGIKKAEPTFLVQDESEVGTEMLPTEIAGVLREFGDVMPSELPKRREIDHQIELVPGAKPPAAVPYRMAPPELEELRCQLKELMDSGYIQPSKAPYGAPVLFQKKQDESLRLCIAYRALNKLTVKNKYPIPLIEDLFDRLGDAKFFTKLDLRSGYYQVRIAAGDEPKTTCVTRYGSFEFLVMPFGLTNAPATFCTLIHHVFGTFLDKFVVIYLDDIVIYSQTLEEHIEHLQQVFQKLRDNELYVKREKCSFAQRQVHFLGHVISEGRLLMDDSKIRAIQNWEAPKKLTELRSFLGLTNYYRKFIKSYSAIATPLTNLLKKGQAWTWDAKAQDAFEGPTNLSWSFRITPSTSKYIQMLRILLLEEF